MARPSRPVRAVYRAGPRVVIAALAVLLVVGLLYSLQGAQAAPAVTLAPGARTSHPRPLLRPHAVAQSASADAVDGDLPLIVGGQDADPGEWPWQAMVLPGDYLCGGSLIAPDWVVTAAHCVVQENGTPFPPAQVQVVLGKHQYLAADATQQVHAVSQVIAHPSYNPLTADHDVALLKLAAPALLNSAVQPVPLVRSPVDDALVAPGEIAWVTGWGALASGGDPPAVLQEVDVPIVSNSACNVAYGGDITANMLCAGYTQGGKDACQGDSGGPLVVSDGVGGWRLAGIVSWGYECAAPGFPGVYARVSRYVAWIEAQTGPGATSTPPTATHTAIPPTATATPSSTATATPTATTTPATATPTPTATTTPATATPVPSATPTQESVVYTAYLAQLHTSPTDTPVPSPSPPPPSGGIRNGDFEEGPEQGWTSYSAKGWRLIIDASKLPIAPYAGNWAAWLGGDDDEIAYIAQQVQLPAQNHDLRFYYQINSSDACGYDFGGVIVDGKVVDVFDLCASTTTNRWMLRTVSLADYAGRAVWLQIRAETDETVASNLLIDNVTLGDAQLAPGDAQSAPLDGAALKPGLLKQALHEEPAEAWGSEPTLLRPAGAARPPK